MNRRDVLKQAAATAAVASVGASAVGGAGCATVPRAPAPRDDRAAANYLAMIMLVQVNLYDPGTPYYHFTFPSTYSPALTDSGAKQAVREAVLAF